MGLRHVPLPRVQDRPIVVGGRRGVVGGGRQHRVLLRVGLPEYHVLVGGIGGRHMVAVVKRQVVGVDADVRGMKVARGRYSCSSGGGGGMEVMFIVLHMLLLHLPCWF